MKRHHAMVKRQRHTGFTLVELMVGLGLGLLTVAIIAQVVMVSEGQKRSTTNGTDAQISGALALYAIQHDVQMSGYGVTNNTDAMGCNVKYKSTSSSGTAISGNFNLAPVVIDDDGQGSDMVTVLRSAKSTFATPMKVMIFHDQTATSFTVSSTVGVTNGDLLIAVPQDISTSNCAIIQVNDVPATQPLTSTVIPHGPSASAPWNPSDLTSIIPAGGYPRTSSYLLNLGSMVMNRYSVDHGKYALQVSSMSRGGPSWSTPIDVQPQIVVMKALYGKDTNNDKVVDLYDKTTPTDWTQVRSIRVLVVARSAQYEKEAVTTDFIDTTGNLQWNVGSTDVTVTGATVCHTTSQCLAVSLTFLGTDWNHYRYKVYDTVIPLRNVMWNS